VISRERLAELNRSATWVPQSGPQVAALRSDADQLLYGGSAGGGKTDLALGKALTRHRRSLILRREFPQLKGMLERSQQVYAGCGKWNGSLATWRCSYLGVERVIEFGSCQYETDKVKFRGRPHDLLVFDETAEFLEAQVRFIAAWLRTEVPDQRCQLLLPSNPPSNAEGEWVIRWFAPWLDPAFPNPALPGELRWVAMLVGDDRNAREEWVDGPEPFLHRGELIQPISRTFIPSRLADNKYLCATGYGRQLQALPEPLRSQLLHGDFTVGRKDDDWQVIPSAWVKAAMDRWKPLPKEKLGQVTSVGVDPSGGGDEATIAPRRGWRYDPLVLVAPDATGHVSGGMIAKKTIDVAGDVAPVHVDIIGIGASAGEHLEAYIGDRVVRVNGAEEGKGTDFTGKLKFVNKRAECWWKMRETLAPERPVKVALPPDQRVFADLTAPRYTLTARGIQVERKDQVKKRLGRSPDRGDAVVLAAMRTPVLTDRRGR
jgi:hypothetical protein